MSEEPQTGTEAPPHELHVPHPTHDGGLLAIAIFKLGKALFFAALGFGALHLLHKDLADEVVKLAIALHRDPEGGLVTLVLNNVGLIDTHRLRLIGIGSFAYAGLALTEGLGLILEQTWAEYLTFMLTVAFLPWECFELIRDPGWMRASLLAINLAVLAYLVWLLRRKRVAGLRAVAPANS